MTLSSAYNDTFKLPLLWHLCGSAFVLFLMIARRYAFRSGLFMVFAWSLLSTLAHELSHYFMGKLCRAKVQGFTLLPRSEGNRVVLGSVSFLDLNAVTSPIVALSPLTLLLLAYFLFIHWATFFSSSLSS